MDVGPGAGCWDEVDDVDTVGEEADVAGVALEGARAWPAPEVGGGWTAAREPGPDVVREAAASVGERPGVGDDAPGAGAGAGDDEA